MSLRLIVHEPHSGHVRLGGVCTHFAVAVYCVNSVLACAAPDNTEAAQLVPLLANRPLKDGKATAYVCQNYTCRAPVSDPLVLEQQLRE